MSKKSKAERRAAFNARVVASWQMHDTDDISTERLLAMVCDDCGCESDRVVAALIEAGVLKPIKTD